MRTLGTLTKWNDERGFGFISPVHGGDEVFVHISAYSRDAGRPRLHEKISFETEIGPNGKPRAIRVTRPGHPQPPRQKREHQARRTTRGNYSGIVLLGAIAAIGIYAYSRWDGRLPRFPSSEVRTAMPESATRFRCDGRTACSHMTSCEEATFFLQHCPNTQMDGDGDGVPCERQWCN